MLPMFTIWSPPAPGPTAEFEVKVQSCTVAQPGQNSKKGDTFLDVS